MFFSEVRALCWVVARIYHPTFTSICDRLKRFSLRRYLLIHSNFIAWIIATECQVWKRFQGSHISILHRFNHRFKCCNYAKAVSCHWDSLHLPHQVQVCHFSNARTQIRKHRGRFKSFELFLHQVLYQIDHASNWTAAWKTACIKAHGNSC